jgi:hypothetical protein
VNHMDTIEQHNADLSVHPAFAPVAQDEINGGTARHPRAQVRQL